MPVEQLRKELERVVADLAGTDEVPVQLERPRNPEHGDWATNVALVLAGRLKQSPRQIAETIAERLDVAASGVTSVEVAGPGFINFRLAGAVLEGQLAEIVSADRAYGRSEVGGGRRVIVEFVSANPTGPLHVAHGRGAVLGDAIASLLDWTGYDVHREFYVNDAGVQIDKLALSLEARWLTLQGEETEIPEGGYLGQYLVDMAAEVEAEAGDELRAMDREARLQWLRDWAVTRLKDGQDRDLRELRVFFDEFYHESRLYAEDRVQETLRELEERGLTYESEGALWLRTSTFGDDKDRVLRKSDGSYTYFTPDIAYHRDKARRGFDLAIDVWGADHHGYVPRMRAALLALGHDASQFEVVITQLVSLERDGEAVAMSGRTGDLIELDEIIGEVGADAVRFTYLLQSVDTAQTVDLELIKRKVMDNPVFYVQMAHARLRSIERVAGERGVERLPLDEVDLSLLVHERELDVLRQLFTLPDTIAAACADRAPHRVTAWLRELAAAVHGFYHDCYVMGEGVPPELTQARLWLVEAARIGLVCGLDVLGVNAPESM